MNTVQIIYIESHLKSEIESGNISIYWFCVGKHKHKSLYLKKSSKIKSCAFTPFLQEVHHLPFHQT